MFSRRSFSALLTGASLAVLAAATGRAAAGTTTTINQPVFNWIDDTDWLNIDSTSVVGTFTNSATISDGLGNPDGSGALGVHVQDGAEIDVFVNDGTIFATENGDPVTGNTTASEAGALGLHVSGDVASTINNGEMGADAFGYEFVAVGNADASGFATGAYFESYGPSDGTVADFDNSSTVGVTAGAAATSLDSEARAVAGGFGVYVEFGDWDTAVSSAVTNDGLVDVLVDAFASGDELARATASGIGIGQEYENVDGASATVVNDGDITVGVTATAIAAGDALADSDEGTFGIFQDVDVDMAAGLAASAEASNAGTMTVSNAMTASAQTGGVLADSGARGFQQYVRGGADNLASATNLGTASVSASAIASIGEGTYAAAFSDAVGIGQTVLGTDAAPFSLSASAAADNQGSLSVSAMASATGTYVEDSPGAFAVAQGIRQTAYDAGALSAMASNTGSLSVVADATADFEAGTYVSAASFAVGVSQNLDNREEVAGSAVASFTNEGSVTVQATSSNTLDYAAFAPSYAIAGGAGQSIFDVDSADIDFENGASGTISVAADSASDASLAVSAAIAIGVVQSADTEREGATADLTATNLGILTVDSMARADGTYLAAASGYAIGISQEADANGATILATNSGTLSVSAEAMASVVTGDFDGPEYAIAYNTYVGGIRQTANGDAIGSAMASNDGTISVVAGATASAGTYAAAGSMSFGVLQQASGLDASTTFDNSGVVSVAGSTAAKSDNLAIAFVGARGVIQDVDGDGEADTTSSAVAEIINDDTIFGSAEAVAGGLTSAQSTYAAAMAYSVGASQEVWDATSGQAILTNSGTIAASSTATATGNAAMAGASSVGYDAGLGDLDTASASFTNQSTGAIWASAEAEANGTDMTYAGAQAVGVSIGDQFDLDALQIDAVNKGLIAASALATANGNGFDEAGAAMAMGVTLSGDSLTGQFKNSTSGIIAASAAAFGAESTARAIGIEAVSDQNGMLILNNGLVSAYAEGQQAMATGIRIAATHATMTTFGPPPAADLMAVATIENHGDIWAGISTDGGDTILRGNAINTQDAPNAVTILLENHDPANIFGNIDISADDQIIVQNGTTKFDGVINPDAALEGGLTIRSGGKLVMLNNNAVEGPSRAFVNAFEMGKNGTLQLNLKPDNSAGAYPTIASNTAALGGTFRAKYASGLYGDKTIYENVITSNGRTGRFDDVTDNSALLSTKLLYDADENVDIKVKRVGFGDVNGLTRNQKSAGGGIEKVYDDLPNSGPFSDIVQDLFTLDGAQYAAAMDQLAGAEYAQLMQSVLGSTGQLNASITDRMDCSVETNLLAQGADARKGCFDPNKVQVWARVGGAWNDSDGDSEAPGYDETQTSIYIGGDYAINTNVFIGAVGGYFNSSMDFDDWGGRNGASMNYDGGQIALYGGYDDGVWYGRNILSYGFYSGDSRRDFGINTTPKALTGDYNTDVVSYYAEAGRRFQLMEQVAATPFLGLGLASAGIDSFTEKDPNGTGAALQIRGADSSSVATTLGFRVNGKWGGFRPEATLAWQHQFADARQTVDMSYAGAPKGANFDVVSSDPGSDALIVGLGASYAVTASSVVTLRYDGTFWSGLNSQQLTARWTSKF